MPEESIDEIYIEITAEADSAISSINELIDALNGIGSKIDTEAASDASRGLSVLAQSVRSVIEACDGSENLSEFSNEVKRIADSFTALSSVTNVVNFNDGSVFVNTGKAKKASDAVDGLTKSMKDAGNETVTLTNNGLAYNRTLTGTIAKLGKFALLVGVARRALSDSVSLAAEATSTMNRLRLTFGGFSDDAISLAGDLSNAVGIDNMQFLDYMATMGQTLRAEGLSNEQLYIMSKNYTQLAYDMAAATRSTKTVEDVFLALQNASAGELEMMRKLGVDVSSTTAKETALALGIDKAYDSMTEAEKELVRYAAVMEATAGYQGYFAETLYTPATQLIVLDNQIKMVSRSIGSLFIPMLTAVLPVLNAVIQGITAVVQALARLFGSELEFAVDFDSALAGAGGVSSALDDAVGSAKELKKQLLGFDEINNITPQSSSGNGAGTAGGGVGFDFELPDYNFLDKLAQKDLPQILADMKSLVAPTIAVGAGIAAWEIITKIGEVDKMKASLKTTAGAVLSISGAFELVSASVDAFANGVSWETLNGMLSGTAMLAGGLAMLFGKVGAGIALIASGIDMIVAGLNDIHDKGITVENVLTVAIGAGAVAAGVGLIALANNVKGATDSLFSLGKGAKAAKDASAAASEGAKMLGTGATTASAGAKSLSISALSLSASFLLVAGGVWIIADAVKGLAEAGPGGIEALAGITVAVVSVVAALTVASQFLAGKELVLLSLGAAIALIGVGLGVVISAVADLCGQLPTVAEYGPAAAAGLIEIDAAAVLLGISLVAAAAGMVAFTIAAAATVIGLAAASLGFDIAAVSVGLLDIAMLALMVEMGNVSSQASDTANTIESMKGSLSIVETGLDALGGTAKKVLDGIVSMFDSSSSSIESASMKMQASFSTMFNGVVDTAKSAGKSAGDGFASSFKSAISNMDMPHISVNMSSADIAGGTIKYPSSFNVKWYAEGGMPSMGELFVARESGPELVGRMGNSSAVANNDQIVEGIASGVRSANADEVALLRQQNELLAELLAKELNVSLDGSSIAKSINRASREQGRRLVYA